MREEWGGHVTAGSVVDTIALINKPEFENAKVRFFGVFNEDLRRHFGDHEDKPKDLVVTIRDDKIEVEFAQSDEYYVAMIASSPPFTPSQPKQDIDFAMGRLRTIATTGEPTDQVFACEAIIRCVSILAGNAQ